MTQTVVRCPYCVLGLQFRPMVPHVDGRFVCDMCGHASASGSTTFKCSCRRCGELQSSRTHRDISPILKIKNIAS